MVMKHLKHIVGLLWLLPFVVSAQELTVQAPQSVYEGDNFTVRFVVNESAKDFRGPSFKGFSLRSGPNQSSSTSMSFSNGQVSRSTTTSFSYTLTADGGAGSFTVGSASCTVDGKSLSSQPFTIKVEKLSAAQKQQRQQQQQQSQRQAFDPWAQEPQQAAEINEKSLFAKASVNKTNPYQGEQVIVTYKIYTQVPIQQYAIDKLPGNRGFWAEDLSVGQQIKQYEETVDGQRYMVAEIRRGALFAQESGNLSIEPLNLTVLAMVQQQRRRTGSIWDLFDDAFFNTRQAQEKSLNTKKININVKPLPAAPAGFSGAVGRFSVKGGLNLDRVKANEAVSYKVTVSGAGNLMLLDAPQPEFPSVFEVYDPQIDDNIKKGDNGISGSRTYEWVLIPRSPGSYTIPALKFVYFDPATGQYQTCKVEKQEIDVDKGSARGGQSEYGGVSERKSDINYIRPVGKLRPVKDKEQAGWAFYLVLGLVMAAAAAVMLLVEKHRRAEADVLGMRQKRAVREARKRLKKAEACLGRGDTARFYEEIYKAIWGCLSDKYSIAPSRLSRDTVSSCLVEKQIPAEQQERIMKVLQDVDMARFAPGDPESQKQTVYSEALNMIASL